MGDSRDSDGFTLIELVVSITVIALGIVGSIGVMSSSFGVAVRTDRRTTATNLATKTVEALRATPYQQIATSNTTTTTQQAVKGTTYTISQGVAAASDGKQATVDVTWTDRGGSHDVKQSTLIYPGGLSSAPTTTVAGTCGIPNNPSPVSAITPLDVSGTTGIDVSWTPPVSTPSPIASWIVQWSVDAFATVQTVTSSLYGSITALRVTGLSSGTTYQFRIASIGVCGQVSGWSPIATATTAVWAGAGCLMGAPSVTPSAVERSNNGNSAVLAATPIVSLNTSGTCLTFTIQFSPRQGVTRTLALIKGTGGVYSTPITNATTEGWDVGQHAIDVYDSSSTKRATVILTVCEHNAASCK